MRTEVLELHEPGRQVNMERQLVSSGLWACDETEAIDSDSKDRLTRCAQVRRP